MRVRRFLSVSAMLLASAIVASGCVVEVTFEPAGGNVTLDGTWLVNGAAADATTCAAAGVDRVELRILEADGTGPTATVGDGVYVYHRWPCSEGGFDARVDTTLPRLVNDAFFTRWFAYDASGAQVGVSDPLLLDLTTGISHATLATPDFTVTAPPPPPPPGFDPTGTDVTTEGSWLINGGPADAASCEAVGLDTVQLVILNADQTEEWTMDFDCVVGGFNSRDTGTGPTLTRGMYNSGWRALDADGAVIGESEILILDLTASISHAIFAIPDFTLDPLVTTLGINLSWQTTGGAGATCAEASVGPFNYSLLNGSGVEVDVGTAVPCTELIEFEDIASDTYSITIMADATDSALKWNGTCSDMVVENGYELYDCLVSM